jgi:aspartate aminotransferase/aminotransferase
VTQGIAPLQDKLQQQIDREFGHTDRKVFVTSGTSGALVLATLAMVEPGDEVILFDPFFVMYEPLVQLVGGQPVLIDTYPSFQIDLNRVDSAISARTKLILFNSPANPTGAVASEEAVWGLAEIARRHDVALVSDEIYSRFCFDRPFLSPAKFNDRTLVIDGFSKGYGMTGWRVGYAHGPAEIIDTMVKLQQYTFVCAPQPAQWASVAAIDFDTSNLMDAYRRKRDRIVQGVGDLYEIASPGGAFYVFPKAPRGTGTEFVARAIENQLLIIPGHIFSRRDTHFRVSYAASEATIDRGIEILRRLASVPY